MSFAPILPLAGYGGWAFLQRTKAVQQTAFVRSPQMNRLAEHAQANLAKVNSAEALVADRKLLEVALGAFGLGEEINNKFFIRKVLESPLDDPKSLANKLSDRRFAKLAVAFGFGTPGGTPPRDATFANRVVEAWRTRSFEVAVGERDDTMRLAMNADRELAEMAISGATNNTMWYSVMGNPPLRKVLEGALGLPTSFGRLDLDRQMSEFKARARNTFGSDNLAHFSDPKAREDLVRKFLLRTEALAAMTTITPASGALQLLQSAARITHLR